MKLSCDYVVEKETEKAVMIKQYEKNCFGYETKCIWLPKSKCDIQTYVESCGLLNKPVTYGKKVVAIESWLMNKIRR